MTQKHKAPVGVISGTGVAEHFEVSDGNVVKTEYGAVVPAEVLEIMNRTDSKVKDLIVTAVRLPRGE
jgi:hypothetical protein